MPVAVIGAGAAGLAAARRLHDSGQVVRVFEAQDRLGGRIWTDRSFAGVPLEHGAEVIHGDAAVSWDLVDERPGDAILFGDYPNFSYWHEGRVLAGDEFSRLPDVARALALESRELRAQNPDPDISWAAWVRSLRLAPVAERFALRSLADIYLAEPENLSLREVAHEERVHHAGHGNFHLRRGQDQIVRQLAEGLDIRLGSPVTGIQWASNGAAVTVAGGESFQADQVVITVPLSLLQEGRLAFNPPLPTQTSDAVHALHMGTAVKFHLLFRKRWWPADLSVLVELEEVSAWWAPYRGEETQPAVLTGWVTASRAEAWSQLSEREVLSRALADLGRLFRSTLPQETYLRGMRIVWSAEPWARGGYSSVPVGAFGARATLAEPVGDVLFFAGEHTAAETNPATVHGAIESGYRAAQQILAVQR